jgi:beta-lactamase class A
MKRAALLLTALLLTGFGGCAPPPSTGGVAPRAATAPALLPLERRIRDLLPADDTLEVAVALRDLATGDSLLIGAHTVMHAASTMKVPVMLELFRRIDAGELAPGQPVAVVNEFRSIADGSSYSLSPADDSDREIYQRIGEELPLVELMERMIVRSSNLATNILIALAEPERIARSMERLNASDVRVLRGVEDGAAFRRGMNNTTTAYGMMKVMEALATGSLVSERSAREMIRILEGQEFQETIPAGLPAGTRVGNKTGWITGINHDAAIVLPEGREPYVLVILTRGFHDRAAARATGSAISREVYEALVAGR